MTIEADPLMGGVKGVHLAITRALKVLIEESRVFAKVIPGDRDREEGFRLYARTCCDLLHAHHDGEEAVGFVRLRDGMTPEQEKALHDQHEGMLESLHALQTCVALPAPWSAAHWGELHRWASALYAGWEIHRRDEEEYMSKAAVRLSPDERAVLAKDLERHGISDAGPGERVVPFILYNLEGKDRDDMRRRFPFYLKDILVPFIWRAEYKAMEPFFCPR